MLVTGATGFIGSHVLRILVEEGCDVHGLIRPESDLRRVEALLPRVGVVRADLYDTEAITAHLERLRPDLCVHLAWTTEPGKYLRSLENLKLLEASWKLASRLAEAGCKRLVAAGTCFEYDIDAGYLSEQTPTRPRTLYAAAKVSLALLLEQLQSSTGMEVAWVRLFYQYGPHEDERRLVPSVILSLLQDRPAAVSAGTQVRDFLHVEDVARAISAVARSGLTGPVNVGSGQPVTVREVVATIGALTGRPD
ncbi:MAG: NAD-dependent epimerase/dehydratase family protein, partial [Candidatus Rokuibacteriota bacterium]